MEMYNHRYPLTRNIPYSPYELANDDWNNRPNLDHAYIRLKQL